MQMCSSCSCRTSTWHTRRLLPQVPKLGLIQIVVFIGFMEVMEGHANPRIPAHPWSREDPDFVYATQSGLWRPGHPIGREMTAVDSETGEEVEAAYFLFILVVVFPYW